MLNFYDVPASAPAGGSTAGMMMPSFATGRADIKATWQPWFGLNGNLAPPQGLDISLDVIAACLGAEDNKAGMPLDVAKNYIRVYLDETLINRDIVANEFMAELPPYHRGAADAVLAVAVSLAVAKHKGFHWFTTKRAFNRLFPALGPLWKKRWPNDRDGGPDYFMGRAFGNTAFYEIKGNGGPSNHPPVKFYQHKTQSINAVFLNQPQRHILSIVNLPADGISALNVDVQWFNSSPESSEAEYSEPTAIQKMQMLLVAVCQFETQLKIYQQDFFSCIHLSEDDWVPYVNGVISVGRGGRALKIAVESEARSLFGKIYSFIEEIEHHFGQSNELPQLDKPDVLQFMDTLIEGLHFLLKGPQHLESALENSEVNTLYRYSNGIRIVSIDDDPNEVVLRDRG